MGIQSIVSVVTGLVDKMQSSCNFLFPPSGEDDEKSTSKLKNSSTKNLKHKKKTRNEKDKREQISNDNEIYSIRLRTLYDEIIICPLSDTIVCGVQQPGWKPPEKNEEEGSEDDL